jgi:Ca-activated chloride channel family protein
MSHNKGKNMSQPSRNRQGKPAGGRNIWISLAAIMISVVVCVSTVGGFGYWLVARFFDSTPADRPERSPTWATDSAELTIAVSPVMAPVLAKLAGQFNQDGQRTPDGQMMQVRLQIEQPEKMIEAALGSPGFQALSPDSSLWLDQLEQAWSQHVGEPGSEAAMPIGERRTSAQTRYAVSPVVIVAWESVARELGWPNQAIGWRAIQRKAIQDANFKWNHASTNNASGLLATLAEFYAGAGLTRGLTAEAASSEQTLAYVRAVEATVRFYGEGEEVIVQRLASEGRAFLDAFVAQEQVVINWNNNARGDHLVAIYPAEGALWTDHPLALLELGKQPGELGVTDNQRLTYQAFATFLTSTPIQKELLAAGYRPADLTIALDAEGSPFANTTAVDWRQPQTTLQMPSPAVVEVVRNFWYYAKRPTNVYLVVDTSGSMEGEKIVRTREALQAFVRQIKGSRDRVGIIEFASGAKSFTPLRTVDEGVRNDLLAVISQMEAVGGTALIDAVYSAVADLQAQGDAEAINAIVVMTDGQENESGYGLHDLRVLIGSQSTAQLVIFTIAFGEDADEQLLRNIAELGNGQFRRADETDIEELYRLISTYF